MDDHFRAFSFVDRITSVQPAARIEGRFAIPPGLDAFPSSLVAEAVGQLAAWAAMAAVQFASRPVAGIAGRIELLADVRPGQLLELSADLETVDPDDVAYRGGAQVDGVPVIRLHDCVGPMVPMAGFDDPEAVRGRYTLLCEAGAAPGGFEGVPALRIERTGGETGRWVGACLQVPATAPFFADHFRRQPVFPGTLLLHANLQLAAALAAELPATNPQDHWTPRTVSDVKLRAFIPPGDRLELEAKLDACSSHSATVTVTTRKGPRLLGGAQVTFAREVRP